MPVKKLFDIVIGGGDVGGTYNNDVGQLIPHTLFADSAIKECWYVPVDNLSNLTFFDHIDVAVGQINDGDIILTFQPNQPALLRLFIYGEGDKL